MDLYGYNKGGVFKKLPSTVNSDHAGISVRVESDSGTHIVGTLNISNPAHHGYFDNDNSSFRESHLNTKNKGDEGKKWLEDKIAQQMENQILALTKGDVHVLVLVEAYKAFIETMRTKLPPWIFMVYQPGEKPTTNTTVILVNCRLYRVLTATVRATSYQEDNVDRTMVTPMVTILAADAATNAHALTVVGVHLPGNATQFPLCALKKLNELMPDGDVIAIGDFNTTPSNIKRILGDVVEPAYPTHANTLHEVTVYDNAVVRGTCTATVMPVTTQSCDTQDLVAALYDLYANNK